MKRQKAIITTASLFPPINVVPPPNDLELSDKISQVLQSIIFNRLFNYYEGGGILEDIILFLKVVFCPTFSKSSVLSYFF